MWNYLNPLVFSSRGNHFLLAPWSRSTNIVCSFLGNSFNLLWGLAFEHNSSAIVTVSFNLAISILHLIESHILLWSRQTSLAGHHYDMYVLYKSMKVAGKYYKYRFVTISQRNSNLGLCLSHTHACTHTRQSLFFFRFSHISEKW